ncbi:hypothetical protein Cni_G16228 [Canna indica]|uniref:BED-type domain-containing protein n=1 Tax=Canna indica TaxID=4628 RepID=A0AAQ3QFG7_9LILI|nr:hypothetical protein Cni_G16228 [Canna indica]
MVQIACTIPTDDNTSKSSNPELVAMDLNQVPTDEVGSEIPEAFVPQKIAYVPDHPISYKKRNRSSHELETQRRSKMKMLMKFTINLESDDDDDEPLMFETIGTGTGSTGATSRTRRKNVAGNRIDIGWKHGTDVQGNGRKVKCNNCSKTISGGIFRFEHHLACTREDSEPCATVPQEVKELMLKIVAEAKEASLKKRKFDEDFSEETKKDNSSLSKGKGILNFVTKGKGDGTQLTINRMMKKDLKEQVDYQCNLFFYTSALPFNAVKNPEFEKFCEMVGRY